MNRYRLLSLVLVFLLAGCQKAPQDSAQVADLVLNNGYVYTVDGARQVAQALAVKDKRIIAVGSDDAISKFIGDGTRVYDLQGRMVMPGLHDAHIHTLGIIQPDICDIRSQAMSLDEMVPFLQDCLDRFPVPAGEWMAVPQWNFTKGNQPSETYPTLRAALDAVSSEHPIILYGNDGHHGAVNSLALSLATDSSGKQTGLNAGTLEEVFADYAQLVAVDAQGEPTGGINEGARELMHPPSVFDVMLGVGDNVPGSFMVKVAEKLAANGITSVQDAALEPDSLAAFADLERSGKMTFRLSAALFEQPENSQSEEGLARIPEFVEKFSRAREKYSGDELITLQTVKLFVDGVIEGDPLATPPTLPNAAVLSDYKQPRFRVDAKNQRLDLLGYVDTNSELCRSVRSSDKYRGHAASSSFNLEHGFFPSQCRTNNGVLEHSEGFIHSFVRQMTEAGFSVHAHAIGDRAVRVALDAFAENKEAVDRAGLTQSIAHAQLVHPDDQKRLGDLGIYMAMTFAWVLPDPEYDISVIPFLEQVGSVSEMYDPNLYYMQNVYPARSVVAGGGFVVAGSDAPVDTREPRPFVNLQQAVTRSADGMAYNASEQLSIEQAIDAFTINAARMLKQSDKVGSIEVGKLADLVVLDQNLVELVEQEQADHIAATRVLMTVFNGRVVYESPEL